jgi:hypothetical protein
MSASKSQNDALEKLLRELNPSPEQLPPLLKIVSQLQNDLPTIFKAIEEYDSSIGTMPPTVAATEDREVVDEDGQLEKEYLNDVNKDVMICKIVSQLKAITMKLYSQGKIYTGTATYDMDTGEIDWNFNGDEQPYDIYDEIPAIIEDTIAAGAIGEEIIFDFPRI